MKVKVAQSCLTLCDPMGYTVHGIFQASILDSLPAETPGKPKNIGVGSLSLLQRLFRTQESNQGLLQSFGVLNNEIPSGKEGSGASLVLGLSTN